MAFDPAASGRIAKSAPAAVKPASQVAAENEATIRQQADAALVANATYLALASPSAAQNAAQVQRLTKECNALIRLVIGKLDSVAGTS